MEYLLANFDYWSTIIPQVPFFRNFVKRKVSYDPTRSRGLTPLGLIGLFQIIYPVDHLVLQFLGRPGMRPWIIV